MFSHDQADFATLLARRDLLRIAVAAAATAVAGCAVGDERGSTEPWPTATVPTLAPPTLRNRSTLPSSTISPGTTTSTVPPGLSLIKAPTPDGAISKLPGDDNLLGWTVDDGISTECVRRYIEFAATSGTRLTFFVTGRCPSWKEVADDLQPLVTSGQIQLANHTYHHENLTTVSDHRISNDLQRNHDFLLDTFGVDCRPFYRPPFGHHNRRTDRIAASIGYTVPVMWRGVLEDAAGSKPKAIVENAEHCFKPQAIVIGHLNHLAITEVFAELQAIATSRGLQTVTLNDVFVV